VTRDGGVIAKNCILDHRLAGLYRLEEIMQMWTHVIPVVAVVDGVGVYRFFSQWRVMFRVPLLEVFVS
jgi:hypothetical protein